MEEFPQFPEKGLCPPEPEQVITASPWHPHPSDGVGDWHLFSLTPWCARMSTTGVLLDSVPQIPAQDCPRLRQPWKRWTAANPVRRPRRPGLHPALALLPPHPGLRWWPAWAGGSTWFLPALLFIVSLDDPKCLSLCLPNCKREIEQQALCEAAGASQRGDHRHPLSLCPSCLCRVGPPAQSSWTVLCLWLWMALEPRVGSFLEGLLWTEEGELRQVPKAAKDKTQRDGQLSSKDPAAIVPHHVTRPVLARPEPSSEGPLPGWSRVTPSLVSTVLCPCFLTPHQLTPPSLVDVEDIYFTNLLCRFTSSSQPWTGFQSLATVDLGGREATRVLRLGTLPPRLPHWMQAHHLCERTPFHSRRGDFLIFVSKSIHLLKEFNRFLYKGSEVENRYSLPC